jgi:hypothetical protein
MTWTKLGGGWRSRLHVAVDLVEQPGAVQALITDRPHTSDWGNERIIPVTPSDAAGWVLSAVRVGWVPSQPGPRLCLRVIGPSVLGVNSHFTRPAGPGRRPEAVDRNPPDLASVTTRRLASCRVPSRLVATDLIGHARAVRGVPGRRGMGRIRARLTTIP